MAKHPSIVFSKSLLPPGSQRVTKSDGCRVWIIQGMEFNTKRDYFTWLAGRKGNPQPEAEVQKASAADIMNDAEFTDGSEIPEPEELQEAAVLEGTLDFDPVAEEES